MTRAVAVVVAAVLLQGCVMKERYRYVQNQPWCFDGTLDPVAGAPGENRPFASVDCRSAFYKIAFIEFDQRGGLIDRAQENKARALIAAEKRRAQGGKIITLVYVHGWKNNTDQARPGAKAKDVERFSTALAELGHRARLASPDNPVPVVGVYIGWKGKSLMGPGFFTWLSFWGRRNTANRVGDKTLGQVLNAIITDTNDGSAQSRVMLVGHSFGARVLEHAIEQGDVRLYDPVRLGEVVAPRVDLVLYVNSANDARLSLGRVQTLQRDPIVVRHPDYREDACRTAEEKKQPVCRPYPLLVTVMSEGDLATKHLLRIANRINLDKNSAPAASPPAAGTFLDAVPSAGDFTRRSAGHMRFMHSHDVTEMDCPGAVADPARCAADDPTCAFAFRSRGDCTACFRANERVAQEGKPPFNTTAHWIMRVDKRISKDHGDIWNLSMISMLGEMMAPRGFFDPAAGRMQIRMVR